MMRPPSAEVAVDGTGRPHQLRMQVGLNPTTLAGRSLAQPKITKVVRVVCIEHGGLNGPATGENANAASAENHAE